MILRNTNLIIKFPDGYGLCSEEIFSPEQELSPPQVATGIGNDNQLEI